MKRQYVLALTVIVVVIGLVFFGVSKANGNYLDKKSADKSQKVKCAVVGTEHVVNIKDDKLEPTHVDALACDKLTIKNNDNRFRLMAFGQHEFHVSYNGIIEKELYSGESFSVTLDQKGNFIFHDHLNDEVQGSFTVK